MDFVIRSFVLVAAVAFLILFTLTKIISCDNLRQHKCPTGIEAPPSQPTIGKSIQVNLAWLLIIFVPATALKFI